MLAPADVEVDDDTVVSKNASLQEDGVAITFEKANNVVYYVAMANIIKVGRI